ncbi:MAG: alpha/beta hydrolase [Pigmentiphaga sp.]|uniref:alpha/beta fold hydrolase n=1 Tax=Pigmentiphaga sp. TaxID=1977564 RepID=UPI0029B0049A|nr:alpha/beta hydrolase [Pigmentiphaga sp.]MDX3904359.1 alpha/beta hydrolase [Pigmentiphaga sp.]
MPKLRIRGNHLNYFDSGTGRPIIFFHSTPATAKFYQPQIAHYSSRYRTLAFDLRGHGDSDKPAGAYRINEFLEDYLAIFDALDLQDFVLVGCSVGGIVAQLYALEHGERLRGLVLIGAPCSRRGRDVAGFHAAVAQSGWPAVVERLVDKQLHSSTPPDVKAWAIQEYLKTPLHVRAAEEEALLADVHHTDRLGDIRVPTLLVAGEEEETEIYEQMEYMATAIPDARHHVIHNAAHMPNFEQPREFNRIMDDFLAGLAY